jgi:hypothetical protein
MVVIACACLGSLTLTAATAAADAVAACLSRCYMRRGVREDASGADTACACLEPLTLTAAAAACLAASCAEVWVKTPQVLLVHALGRWRLLLLLLLPA